MNSLREPLTDAIRYWEPRRLIYNFALAAIVLTYFALGYPGSKASLLSVDGALFLFILAVLANVAYCAVYAVDIFVQLSGFQETWRKYRWLVLLIGILFAGTITRFFAVVFFSNNSAPHP